MCAGTGVEVADGLKAKGSGRSLAFGLDSNFKRAIPAAHLKTFWRSA